jgi:hypothetical protein
VPVSEHGFFPPRCSHQAMALPHLVQGPLPIRLRGGSPFGGGRLWKLLAVETTSCGNY